MLNKDPWSILRFGLVFLVWAVVTWNYYSFSHSIHNHHFRPQHTDSGHGSSSSDGNGKNHSNPFDPQDGHRNGTQDDHGHDHDENRHGRGAFEFDLQNPRPFLYGLALPIVMLTLLSLLWNPSTSPNDTKNKKNLVVSSRGEVNVKKWTFIWFLLPLLLVMFDGALGSHMSRSQGQERGWGLYIRICMSLMSPSGYAATWALALFLIPVTKHSPILDWLRITPVQAVAFHRVAGWTSFWNSLLHGFLHLRHLMDVLNPGHLRPWYQQLKILLIPCSWECISTQNPWHVFWGRQDSLNGGSSEDVNRCWLALVNATGMISVLAFVLLAVTSLPRVRRYSYALFYRVHIPAGWTMLIMAIWHYPTCVLVLVPNIMYYISFNIPVYMAETMKTYEDTKKHSSSLVEARLIEGGSIELVFEASAKEQDRYESRFAKLYIPSVSPLFHPFSVFSRQDLRGPNNEYSSSDENGESPSATLSILLRPTGPFTKGLTKELFINRICNDAATTSLDELTESLVSQSSSTPLLSSPKIQCDSFYAGSFGWIESALHSHDEILLVAGGVGIVPFLNLLPLLQRSIQNGSSSASPGDFNSLLERAHTGPKQIDLHWYCREVGLASYVWYHHLGQHVRHSWENNAACQNRLKIHLHLTSLGYPNSTESDEAAILSRVSNSGLRQKATFRGEIRALQDCPFTRSTWLALLVPGSLMVIGTMVHWWWYKQYILDDKFRDDNLIIRSHSIVFTLAVAMVLSVAVQHFLEMTTENFEHTNTSLSSEVLGNEATGFSSSSLSVSQGRPSVDTVISGIIRADRPGVYLCGPHSLMESVEGAIRGKRSDCAFYREDSEM